MGSINLEMNLRAIMASQTASFPSGATTPMQSETSASSMGTFAGAVLALENVHNLRDLGGLQSRDGRRVSAGRLFRSGNPAKASGADIARLRPLGLDLVIDFRASGEKSAEERGFAEHFNWLALPVMEGNMSMSDLLPRLRVSTPQDMVDFMLQVYRDFPVKHQSAFGRFMKEAEAGQTLLYHCSAGKDRTGFATFLLLSALDVVPETILANYLESNSWNQKLIQDLLVRLEALDVSPEAAMPLLEVRAEYLNASIQAIEQEWGGTTDFLREVLSVNVSRLQENYLEVDPG